ncbi:alginate export family protein [Thalassomonas haliotis]|uniref:Alginate export domain-containing protein n=1 Tax=Thalassomonas haliotis TaxID=485448 RepID=A0ABY7VGN5_9GAMM|nr:alginate export family protein [Thalassomonas haliotis]WDE12606.1 hypothetical protein H3N35_03765 [Thalassomonas haliotis]
MTIHAADNAPSLFEQLPGKHKLGMRSRFQQVNDNWLGDTNAATTRLKLTSSFLLDDDKQWQLLLEPNYVHAFNDGRYNSVSVKKNTSPIPDPQSFNWNKVNLSYNSDSDWQVILGRQALAFDNERMIGTVEFWQTPQSFDAIKLTYNDHMNWHFQYAYSNKVHRIFGRESTASIPENDIRYQDFLSGALAQRPVNEWGEHKLNSHLFNLSYKTDNNLNIVLYDYLIDNRDQPGFSTNTLGLRISDEFKPKKIKYRYTFEFAQQKNAYDNPGNFHTWYNLLEASIQYKSHIFQLNQEVFSQDKWHGFFTPLGSNHKFQGWADAFNGYNTSAGLRDQYVTYRGRKNKLRWRVVWHKFKSYQHGDDIGNEVNVELAYRLTRKWQFKLIYADYRAQQGSIYFARVRHDLSTWFASIAYNI